MMSEPKPVALKPILPKTSRSYSFLDYSYVLTLPYSQAQAMVQLEALLPSLGYKPNKDTFRKGSYWGSFFAVDPRQLRTALSATWQAIDEQNCKLTLHMRVNALGQTINYKTEQIILRILEALGQAFALQNHAIYSQQMALIDTELKQIKKYWLKCVCTMLFWTFGLGCVITIVFNALGVCGFIKQLCINIAIAIGIQKGFSKGLNAE
jgi:hypothetical protein